MRAPPGPRRRRWSRRRHVLFLDEPTTGLDPQSSAELWVLRRGLVRDGTKLLLDDLSAWRTKIVWVTAIVVLDHGRVAPSGSAAELKAATAPSGST